jgi:pimeloyl-ACP methyl ester carboxylesterase
MNAEKWSTSFSGWGIWLWKINSSFAFLVILFIIVSNGRADLVFMKDGFFLQGKVRRDHQIELDPATKEAVAYPKGFFQVDDGARRQYFLPSQARIAEKDQPESGEKISYPKVLFIPHGRPMPSIWEVVQVDEWDDKWDRSFIFKGPNGLVGMRQHLGTITPDWARVDAVNRHRWGCMYLTKEFSDLSLRKLLDSNPESADKSDATSKDRLSKTNKRLNFFIQADRVTEAEIELSRLRNFGPEGVESYEKAKLSVSNLKAANLVSTAKRYSISKQHREAKFVLAGIDGDMANERLMEEARNIVAEADACIERENKVKTLLSKLASILPKDDPLVKPLEAVLGEFHVDNIDRLEGFLGQAEILEKSKGATDGKSVGKLAALAVTGWCLGKASAEDKPDRAFQIWKNRNFILSTLKLASKAARSKAISDEIKGGLLSQFEENALIIGNLPPIQGEVQISKEAKEVVPEADNPSKPRYHYQLPPGYHPGRKWPILVVLHGSGEKPQEHLAKWSKQAGEEGYILLAPHWELGGAKSGYAYSPREHEAVLGAIHSAKHKFRIDDERVFLFGLDGGANAAFDIGLSHPDYFAGVIPMSGGAFYFASAYWRNAQQVPFYVCNGDYAGDLNLKNREIFTNWASRSFPMIWSQYKGRGVEWFAGETTQIFDWMRPKKRLYSFSSLGNGGGLGVLANDYRSLRPTDDSFYWLGFGEIAKSSQLTGDKWNQAVQPAALSAWVDRPANKINIRSSNCVEVVVKLVRNSQGEGVVRMDKPISIMHKLATVWNQKKVDPDLETVLEGVISRGEREILVLKEVRFKP